MYFAYLSGCFLKSAGGLFVMPLFNPFNIYSPSQKKKNTRGVRKHVERASSNDLKSVKHNHEVQPARNSSGHPSELQRAGYQPSPEQRPASRPQPAQASIAPYGSVCLAGAVVADKT
jgi:hypothetical protein